MVNILDLLLSSGGLRIVFWLVLVFVIFIGLGFGIWRFIRARFIYKYRFGIVNYFGKISLKKAKITINKHMVKKFLIDGTNQLLDIEEHNSTVDNLPTRLVSYDGQGNLAYLDNLGKKSINSQKAKLKVDKNEYLKTALKSVEREGIANNIVDATRKYGKMPAEAKWAFGFSAFLVVAVIAGMFLQGKVLAKQYDINSGDVKNLLEATKVIKENSLIMRENLELQKIIMTYVTRDDRNITLGTS